MSKKSEPAYTRLSLQERRRIFILRKKKISINKIAKILGRSHSTISRELKRNEWKVMKNQYLPDAAHRYAQERQKTTHRKTPILSKHKELATYIEKKLQLAWSPEIIAGRLKLENPFNITISYETIYKYIYEQKPELCQYLRWYNAKKRKKRGKIVAKNKLKNRIFIENRNPEINERKTFGHWEADTMEFSKNQTGDIIALNVLVERKSRYILLTPLQNKSSEETTRAIINRLQSLNPNFVKSITFDNGSENAQHEKIAQIFNLNTYFCHPYSGWEKGSVENRIGFLRFFLPKGKVIDNISEIMISNLEMLINSKPLKSLGFKTPAEVLLGCAIAT